MIIKWMRLMSRVKENTRMRNRGLIKLMSVLLMGFVSLGLWCNSYAMDDSSIKAKAAYEGIYNCIGQGAYNQKWLASKVKKKGEGFVTNDASNLDLVKMPYDKSAAKDNSINCKQIMFGWSDPFAGGESVGFLPNEARERKAKDTADYFKNLGYSATGVSRADENTNMQQLVITAPEKCYAVDGFGNMYEMDKQIIEAVDSADGVGKVVNNSIVFPAIIKKEDNAWWSIDGTTIPGATSISVPEPGSNKTYKFKICDRIFDVTENGGSDSNVQYLISTSEVSNAPVNTQGSGYAANSEIGIGPSMNAKVTINEGSAGETASAFDDYEMKWQHVPMTLIKGINDNNKVGYSLPSVSDSHSSLAFTDQEIYDLYTYYVRDVYQAKVACKDEPGYKNYDKNKKIKWVKGKDCLYVAPENYNPPSDRPIYGVFRSTKFFGDEITSLEDLVARLNSLDISNLKTLQSGTDTGEDLDDEEAKREEDEKN